jgi:PDZ domain-containing protein
VAPAPTLGGDDGAGGGSGPADGSGEGDGSSAPGAPATPRRRHRLRWAAVIVAGVLLVALVASLFVPVPYYLIEPGSARATEPLVSVQGGREYPPEEGAIYFTTVSTRPARAFTAFLGWLDPDTDVVDEELILGDNTPEENRQVNLEMMESSVDVAAEVAFEHLGFDVETGTGAIVAGIAPDLPVADALRPGDVIVGVDGVRTTTSDEVVEQIQSHEPGDEVRLRVQYDPSVLEQQDDDSLGDPLPGVGEDDDLTTRTETVELGARPEDEDQPLLGVQLGTRDQEINLPFPVEIDTGQVGGPSAGLAFTLAVLDVLTPGELTGGKDVAVTGTIDGLGNVGPIGGIAQKAAAVRDAGHDVFIVPASEAEQARARAGDVEVIGVETLDDALQALADLGGNALDLEPPQVDQPDEG